jgi:hypothetical protein
LENKLTELFCNVDDFCKKFIPEWQKFLLKSGKIQRQRKNKLSPSEIITIAIHFHQSNYRNFKSFYQKYVQKFLKKFFPNLLSHSRFLQVLQSTFVPLTAFVKTMKSRSTGIYFVDSTLLKVCNIRREKSHKVFAGLAEKSRSTTGWFFGFKLHLIINDHGEIMNFQLTKGNVDDRKPVPDLVENLTGKLIGDKGYLSKPLFNQLFNQGLQLITKIKKNMKNKVMPLIDKLLLRKRAVIESVNDQLKNISQIEHSRHRSVMGFMINLLSGISAYNLQPKKPSIYPQVKQLLANI